MTDWRTQPIAAALLCAVAGSVCAVDSKAGNQADVCRVEVGVTRLVGLPEASGMAISRSSPGSFWSLNDSGKPLVSILDGSGKIARSVQVSGAAVDDWEDVSIGPCPNGSCLYVADIGDNNSSRPEITVYRVPEPRAQDSATARPEVLSATYPDGPHDAEALFVAPGGELFVITKERPSVVYRFPRAADEGRASRLERVVALPLDRVTDAETSPDGTWLAVRTNDELAILRTQSLVSGKVDVALRFDLRSLKEPQGEGVALDSGGTVYLVGEGGGRNGTFATLKCTLPR